MANHFGAIGIVIRSKEEFEKVVGTLMNAGTSTPLTADLGETVWTDPSGARMVVQTRDGKIEFMFPCFAGQTPPAPVANVRMVDQETALLELLDAPGGTMVCPLAVELEDRATLTLRGGHLDQGSLVVSALAEEIVVHADTDAYNESQTGMRFAADFLIPSGTFSLNAADPDWAPSARAIFAGEVLEAETRTNESTGEAFHRVRVRTISALEVDIAVATDELPEAPVAGNIVSGTFFITGRLGLEPVTPAETPADPSRPRKWFKR